MDFKRSRSQRRLLGCAIAALRLGRPGRARRWRQSPSQEAKRDGQDRAAKPARQSPRPSDGQGRRQEASEAKKAAKAAREACAKAAQSRRRQPPAAARGRNSRVASAPNPSVQRGAVAGRDPADDELRAGHAGSRGRRHPRRRPPRARRPRRAPVLPAAPLAAAESAATPAADVALVEAGDRSRPPRQDQRSHRGPEDHRRSARAQARRMDDPAQRRERRGLRPLRGVHRARTRAGRTPR